MKGSETKLAAYMQGSSKRFVIPVYQRNYDWKTENCKQLYDDLVKVIRENKKSHFFGSIVSVFNPDGAHEDFFVIDGQQRLTTVLSLALAVSEASLASLYSPRGSQVPLYRCPQKGEALVRFRPTGDV